VILCRVERFEESVRSLRIEPDSSILHGQAYALSVSFGSNQQLPRTIVDSAHCFGCVAEQVQDHLLKLDTSPATNGTNVQLDLLPRIRPNRSYPLHSKTDGLQQVGPRLGRFIHG
jgi:hypothetical protein